jgi:hypothetical protein
MGHQSGTEISGFTAFFRIALKQFAKLAGGGPIAPMRRSQSLNAAAFLIDEDGDSGICDGGTKRLAERTQLSRGFTVSRKQNKAKRLHITEERALVIAEQRSFTAKNSSSAWGHLFSPTCNSTRGDQAGHA